MKIKEFSALKNEEITENFKSNEFKCKDGSNKILIDVDFVVNILQKIREHINEPLYITSGYRTSTYNIKVGGAKNSYHVKGRAFDVHAKGKTPTELANIAFSLGVKGIIVYPTFVHIDSRESQFFSKDSGKSPCTGFELVHIENESIKNPSKRVEDVAKDVIKGEYGNGNVRKEKLKAEGWNPSEIQSIVNKMLEEW